MHGWIDPFYEECEAAVAAGHIFTDHPIYLPPRHGLKMERVDPNDDRVLEYSIVGRTAEVYDHPPIHSLKLESTEAAVVAKSKRDRPVIVLGGLSASEILPGPDRARHAETAWVVPVYGADQYSEAIRKRFSYYEFTNVFYLPARRASDFDEGFALLDHAQPVMRNHLARHRGLRLSPDALDALVEWFVAYATGRITDDSILLDYRREMLASGGNATA